MKKVSGRVYILGDDINTDDIIPSHTLTLRDPVEMSKFTLEFIDPDFTNKVNERNIILAGDNFGTGSSREEAVNVFKILGIKAIIAKSFARIYFRNLINNGIPAISLEWQENQFSNGDKITIDLLGGKIYNEAKQVSINFEKLPEFLRKILQAGGSLELIKKKIS